MKRSTLNTYDTYPKNIFAQNALYYNMSHHYRRLYNAKPRVDTSTPKCYKALKQKEKITPNIGYNKFQPDLTVCGKSISKKNRITFIDQLGNSKGSWKNDVSDKERVACHPKILKSNVQSKLLSSRVYHPPRKKVVTYADPCANKKEDDLISMSANYHQSGGDIEEYNYEYEDDVDWLQLPSQEPPQDTRSNSKPSSSDSAYTEEGEGMWSGGESRDYSPQQMHHSRPVSRGDNYSLTDNRYVKFLRNITDEVLRKGIYTNKALKKVFQEHIYKNRHTLDVQRMQKEVEKLQKDLGIPKDDDLNDLDFGLGCGDDDMRDSEYGLQYDIIENRLGYNADIPYMAELIESVDQLSVGSAVKDDVNEIEDWLLTKVDSSSWKNNNGNIDLSDNLKIPLKLPNRINDNDSSIGCEILSGSSDNEILSNYLSSSENILGDR